MTKLQTVCLDLDDTLWDLGPVIPRAERALYAWYARHYPEVVQTFAPAEITALRQTMLTENPQLRHDLTELRLLALRRIATESGYPQSMAEQAFRVFDEVRNDVALYADVLPALERLGRHYRLVTLSNGNANLHSIGIARFFAANYAARELGVAKPNIEVFNAVCAREKLRPEQILHVGDHPHNDIVAARAAGMPAVWVNRAGKQWPLAETCPVDAVGCLEELATILGA